jgi:hypothetical protein
MFHDDPQSRQRQILLKGEEAARLWDEITSWDPTPEDDPRRPARLKIFHAHDEAVKRYQASLPWRARRLVRRMQKLEKWQMALSQKHGQALTAFLNLVRKQKNKEKSR